jgi:D-3-phosphoglycerate dehydrogenase
MHNKTWKKEMGLLFKGKILGIVGFGKIGKRVAQLAKAFGAKVIFCDKRTMRRGSTTQVSLDKLLRVSDIISLHVSSKEELINKDKIFRMKEGVILINTSRGHVVSEDALYEALSSGRISSAGLDVYCKEPYNGKLLELNNVVCIPHVGSYAKEARVAMEIEAAENLIKGLKEEGLL